jgi:hypothetical protein
MLRQIIHYTLLGFVFYCIVWFIAFQMNPYTHCKDHPDRRLRAEYYYCEPFGFDLKKGFLEKSTVTPWMKDRTRPDLLRHQKVHKDEDPLENIDSSHISN